MTDMLVSAAAGMGAGPVAAVLAGKMIAENSMIITDTGGGVGTVLADMLEPVTAGMGAGPVAAVLAGTLEPEVSGTMVPVAVGTMIPAKVVDMLVPVSA